MGKLSAFLLGMREYRVMVTTYTDEPDAYDLGREWAHRVTFRKHEEA